MSDWSRADEEWELKMELLRADIRLKNTQSASEWPKVITGILLSVSAAFTAFGWSIGMHHS